MRRILLVSTSVLLGSALCVLACESSESSLAPSSPEAGVIAIDGSTSGVDGGGGGGSDASVPDADAANCGTPGTLSFWDGGILLSPTPYLQASDSPFRCHSFGSYYEIADFEGDAGVPRGVTSAFGNVVPATPGAVDPLIDSVDGDDGHADGGAPDSGSAYPCDRCRSFFNSNGAEGVDFTFDETILGGLPTHAGLVWTDGAPAVDVTFTVYGASGNAVDAQTVQGIGDGSNYGTTAEDRFFGAVYPAGIKRITMRHTGGGIEIDHLQYAR